MKTLYLVRHAKAIPADVGVEDFKRALAKSGKQDAQAVSKRLHKRGIHPDLLVSSPADRALETAHIFAKALDYAIQQIQLQDALYVNTTTSVSAALRELDDAYATVMIFGHNPSISEVAQMFWPTLETDVPTCGVVGIAFDCPSWQAISPEAATLILFDFPIERKPVQKILRANMMATLTALLDQAEPGMAACLAKPIRKSSKRLAKQAVNVMSAAHIRQLAEIAEAPTLPAEKPLRAQQSGRQLSVISVAPGAVQQRDSRGRFVKKASVDTIPEGKSV